MKRRPTLALALLLVGCGGSHSSTVSNGGRAQTPVRTITRQILTEECPYPVQYVANPSNTRLAYVPDRRGVIYVLLDDVLQKTPALDIRDLVDTDASGLLGMALAPDFAKSRAFYLQYISIATGTRSIRVARFQMSPDGLTASRNSEPILRVDTLHELDAAHLGGTIHFKDGLMYLAFGDGSSGGDPLNSAQDPHSILGKVLRIDPSGDDLPDDPDNNYRVPASNPFVGVDGVRGEIWDLGLRNPYRWSFDSKTGAMVLADVGEYAYEEINYEPAGKGGRNYGWRLREGLHESGLSGTPYGPGTLTEPFLDYGHLEGACVIGGYVVRTSTLGLNGRYLFADLISNKLWSLAIDDASGEAAPASLSQALDITPTGKGWNGIVSIDPDAKGRPVVTELFDHRVSRLLPGPTN